MSNSTTGQGRQKAAKRHADSPPWKHPSGRWCKKVKGRFHYFGKVADDPDGRAALERWLDARDDLLAGRPARTPSGELTVRELANAYLTAKKRLVERGKIKQRSFVDYHDAAKRVVEFFGRERVVADLRADDFEQLAVELARGRGLLSQGTLIGRVRAVFRYGYEAGLIDKPVRFGPDFRKPTKGELRKAENGRAPKMFTREEIHALLGVANPVWRAMILLAVNCGFGNEDVADLRLSHLDLEFGWCDYPRPKTGIARRCPLWPETVAALREAMEARPTPKDKAHAGHVFLKPRGEPWNAALTASSIACAFRRLAEKAGAYKPRVTFYALRHTHRTVAGESLDQPACNHIMGHSDNSMASVYTEAISDERLIRVARVVHRWLFGEPEGGAE